MGRRFLKISTIEVYLKVAAEVLGIISWDINQREIQKYPINYPIQNILLF